MKLIRKYQKWSKTWSTSQLVFLMVLVVVLLSTLAFVTYRFEQARTSAYFWHDRYTETKVDCNYWKSLTITNMIK